MRGNSPLVSVVMTTFNHESFVAAAIESVLGQTLEDFELIVIDDNSTDSTREVISQYKDNRIRFIHQKENQGPSIAFNTGAAQATGRYIAMFSGDDVCHPNRLNAQASVLNEGYGEVVFAIPEIIDSDGNLNQISTFNKIFRSFPHYQNQFRNLFFEQNFLCAPSAMMHRKTWLRFGGFHPALLQLQDFELWLRLSKHGVLFCTIELPLIQYRIREDAGNLSSKNQLIRTLNESTYIYRHVFDDIPQELFGEHFKIDLSEHRARNCRFVDQKNAIYLLHSAAFIKLLGIQGVLHQNEPSQSNNSYISQIPILDFFSLCNSIDSLNIHEVNKLTLALVEQKSKWP